MLRNLNFSLFNFFDSYLVSYLESVTSLNTQYFILVLEIFMIMD